MKITIRGDSGFCRLKLMRWCENHDVDYLARSIAGRAFLTTQKAGTMPPATDPKPPTVGNAALAMKIARQVDNTSRKNSLFHTILALLDDADTLRVVGRLSRMVTNRHTRTR